MTIVSLANVEANRRGYKIDRRADDQAGRLSTTLFETAHG